MNAGTKLDDNDRLLRGQLPRDPGADAREMAGVNTDSVNSGPNTGPWEPPLSLDVARVPAFPVGCLPPPLSDYVEALAESTQVPAELPGCLVLAAAAACVQRRVLVQVKPDYIEPLSLFVAVISYPGTRKSAVAGAITRPIQEWEEAERSRLAPEIERLRSERAIKERRKAKLEEMAASANPEMRDKHAREAKEIAVEIANDGNIPSYPRLLADDATPEALARLMVEQGERISLFSAEGGVFEMMAGRYSKGVPNLDVYLKGHAGDMLRVDRRSGPPVLLSHPALTIGLAVQPDVLRALADKPGFRGRGLIARFLFALPPNPMGRRRSDPAPVDPQLAREYGRCIQGLLDASANGGSIRFGFEQDAERARLAFAQRLEPRLGPTGDLGHMGDWAGKAVGLSVRLAGVFQAVSCVQAGRAICGSVEPEAMEAAVKFVETFAIPHARAALAEMGQDQEVDEARRVLSWVLTDGARGFSLRDVHQALRGQACFRKVEGIKRALAVLEGHGYLRHDLSPADRTPGRPSSPRYQVNPMATRHPQNTQNLVGPSGFEDSEDGKSS